MRVKKISIIVLFPLSIVLLGSIIVLEFSDILNTFLIIQHVPLYINLSVSVFSSTLLILIISTMEYGVERKKALESFYIESLEILNLFKKLHPIPPDVDEMDEKEYKKLVSSYEAIGNYCTLNIGNMYSNIDFIFGNNRLRNWIYKNIYREFIDMIHSLLEISYNIDDITRTRKLFCYRVMPAHKAIFRGVFTLSNETEYQMSIYNSFVDRMELSLDQLYTSIYRNRPSKRDIAPVVYRYVNKESEFSQSVL